MSDQDFNFAPPPPRRKRKEFTPPPWEQHLFDQLAQAQETEPAEAETVEVGESASEAEPMASAVEAPATVEDQEASAGPVPSDDGEKVEKPLLDEVRLAGMMFELRAEEVPATRMYAKTTLVAGAVLLLIGIVMVIWSFAMITVALRRPDQARSGAFIGMTVLVFGAGFAGTGAWFVFKTLRQQGVL